MSCRAADQSVSSIRDSMHQVLSPFKDKLGRHAYELEGMLDCWRGESVIAGAKLWENALFWRTRTLPRCVQHGRCPRLFYAPVWLMLWCQSIQFTISSRCWPGNYAHLQHTRHMSFISTTFRSFSCTPVPGNQALNDTWLHLRKRITPSAILRFASGHQIYRY